MFGWSLNKTYILLIVNMNVKIKYFVLNEVNLIDMII